MNRNSWLERLAACAVIFAASSPTFAGKHFHNRHRECTKCGIKGGYHYGADADRHIVSMFARSRPADLRTVTWALPQPWVVGAPPPFPGTYPQTLRSKSFHLPLPGMAIDGIRLEQVGLTLYESGRLDATGVLIHSGGPDAAIQGNWVTLRLRAYAAEAVEAANPLDAPASWECEQRFWLPRGPKTVPLIAAEDRAAAMEVLGLQFDKLNYIQVELEYTNDR